MSLLSKWGFNRRERIAVCILIFALLAGIAATQIRHLSLTQDMDNLTPEDSIAISKLNQFTQTLKDSLSDNDETGIVRETLQPLFPIDINAAAAAELEMLPGIGPVLAGRIVDYRQSHGPFTAVDSLINITGIGSHKLLKIKDLITIQNSRGED